jgi:hypothetical protein
MAASEPRPPRGAKQRLIRPYVELHRKLDSIWESVHELRERQRADAAKTHAMLRHLYDDEPGNRRRLYALRESEEYELAFSEAEPLVSFLVPTYNSYTTLREVALPSILSQTYSNLEVVVVGDAAPPETRQVIEDIGDPRVRYYNRTIRGPYPDDDTRWYVVGTPPYNDALSMARGRWIAGLGDDDAVHPDHTEKLLQAAKEGRYELSYGRQLVRFSNGDELDLGGFPPRLGQLGLQAAIYHSGLRFFGFELTDALYEEPNDWSFCRRMMRVGVRFGAIEHVVVDKHETRRSLEEWKAGKVPKVR